MNSMTIGTAGEARPVNDAPSRAPALSRTAELRVRTLAPTVFCPASTVEQCVQNLPVSHT
jgi:hypothetical protein